MHKGPSFLGRSLRDPAPTAPELDRPIKASHFVSKVNITRTSCEQSIDLLRSAYNDEWMTKDAKLQSQRGIRLERRVNKEKLIRATALHAEVSAHSGTQCFAECRFAKSYRNCLILLPLKSSLIRFQSYMLHSHSFPTSLS